VNCNTYVHMLVTLVVEYYYIYKIENID